MITKNLAFRSSQIHQIVEKTAHLHKHLLSLDFPNLNQPIMRRSSTCLGTIQYSPDQANNPFQAIWWQKL